MINILNIFRFIIKTSLKIVFLPLFLLGLWFVANQLLDESPYQEGLDALQMPVDEIPDHQNIAVGFLGLTAPRNENFIEFGSDTADLFRRGFGLQAWNKMSAEGTLQLTVSQEQTDCWIDSNPWIPPRRKGCLPFDQVAKVLQDNSELLNRYKSLQKQQHYSNLYHYYNKELLNLLRLVLAEIHLHIERGEHELAYRKWHDQFQFSRRILRGRDGWFGKTVAKVTFGFTLPLLENIIEADPDLARKYKKELLSILQTDGVESFNPDGILQAGYSNLELYINTPPAQIGESIGHKLHWLVYYFGHKQRLLNRYQSFARDYREAIRVPWPQVETEMMRLEDNHVYASLWDMLIDPFGTILVSEHTESYTGIKFTVLMPKHIDARIRQAALMVQIVSSDIKDADIPTFIKSAGSAYYNPFSNEAFQWNSEKRRIYLRDPTDPCFLWSSFFVPDSNKQVLQKNSIMNWRLCQSE